MARDGKYRGQVPWEPSDFKKHGRIATYYLGECRCKKCVKRWEAWDPYSNDRHDVKRQMLRR